VIVARFWIWRSAVLVVRVQLENGHAGGCWPCWHMVNRRSACRLLDTRTPAPAPGRYYHSNALLLQSGDVWIAGNEMSDCIDDCKTGMSPPGQEYRAEVLQLPYAFQPRPVIKSVFPSQQMYAQNITVW